MSISGFTGDDIPVPEAIRLLSGRDSVEPIWQNGEGGITFQIGAGAERRFAKWAPAGSSLDLAAEAERLRWAADFAHVPRVLDFGVAATGVFLLTAGLPGQSAIADRWKRHPEVAVRVAGAGLRALHDALPVESCPFDWSPETRLKQLRSAGVDPRRLRPVPPTDRLVVCHGDACVPNTLIDDQGDFAGHVDLGSLGRADRWADIAVATWSTEWNYGPGWEDLFLTAYGVGPDVERTRYYRDLWDLADPV